MNQSLVQAFVALQVGAASLRHRLVKDETGEGVISTAIAVLIMAFLGAAMWVAFSALFGDAAKKTAEQVNKIGTGG